MKVFALRFAILAFVSLNVFCFFWVSQPTAPVKTTMGSLSEKSADFRYQRAVITNGIMGERIGKFIRFKAGTNERHDVILILKDPDLTPDACTAFAGYCYGFQDTPIPDCPFQPPFILIEFATPAQP